MIKKTYSFEKDGKQNDVYTLSNQKGVEVDILTYGAHLIRISVPDKNGNFDDVLVGCKKPEDYYEITPISAELSADSATVSKRVNLPSTAWIISWKSTTRTTAYTAVSPLRLIKRFGRWKLTAIPWLCATRPPIWRAGSPGK